MASNPLVQQLIDLQNRITELAGKGRLDELTQCEVALISYALGVCTADIESRKAPREPEKALEQGGLESLAAVRRAAKKAGFGA